MWRVTGLLLVALFVGTNANFLADVCPVISHENEFYYITSGEPFVMVKLTEWQEDSGIVNTLDCGAYAAGRNLPVSPGECDIICTACGITDKCCEYKYLLTVVEKKCSDDETIPNGEVTIISPLIGGTATVTCNNGYVLRGDDTVLCTDSGVNFEAANGGSEEIGHDACQWANMPTCEKITCAAPGEGSNTITVDPTTPRDLGESYTYTCVSGFYAEPSLLDTVCEEQPDSGTGGWSIEPPTCTKITCAAPGEGSNTITVDPTTQWDLGDIYTYTCVSGFSADPSLLDTVCEEQPDSGTGGWSVDPPSCTRDIGDAEVIGTPPPRQDISELCPEEFILSPPSGEGSTCFLYIDDPDIWEAQAQKCKSKNGQLVIPRSQPDDTRLIAFFNQLRTESEDQVWIGPQALAVSNVFTDFNLQRITYSNFEGNHQEQGDGNGPGPDCVSVNRQSGEWTNECCYIRRPALCQADPAEVGSGEAAPVISRLNCPTNSVPVGGTLCLEYIGDPDIWEAQARKCKGKDGLLLIPQSENVRHLLTYLQSHQDDGVDQVWIGPQALAVSNVFTDFNLQSITYSNFESNRREQGDGNGPGPDCVSVNLQSGEWTNECCYIRRPAICSRPAI